MNNRNYLHKGKLLYPRPLRFFAVAVFAIVLFINSSAVYMFFTPLHFISLSAKASEVTNEGNISLSDYDFKLHHIIPENTTVNEGEWLFLACEVIWNHTAWNVSADNSSIPENETSNNTWEFDFTIYKDILIQLNQSIVFNWETHALEKQKNLPQIIENNNSAKIFFPAGSYGQYIFYLNATFNSTVKSISWKITASLNTSFLPSASFFPEIDNLSITTGSRVYFTAEFYIWNMSFWNNTESNNLNITWFIDNVSFAKGPSCFFDTELPGNYSLKVIIQYYDFYIIRNWNVSVEESHDDAVITIISPIAGNTVEGNITISGIATGNFSKIEILFGPYYREATGKNSWHALFNSSVIENGPCLITVRAKEGFNTLASAEILVYVNNEALLEGEEAKTHRGFIYYPFNGMIFGIIFICPLVIRITRLKIL